MSAFLLSVQRAGKSEAVSESYTPSSPSACAYQHTSSQRSLQPLHHDTHWCSNFGPVASGPCSQGRGRNSGKDCRRRQLLKLEAGHETGKWKWSWRGNTLTSNTMASNDGREELRVKSLGRTLKNIPCARTHPAKDAVSEVMKTVDCPVI